MFPLKKTYFSGAVVLLSPSLSLFVFSKGKGVPRDWSKREVKDVMDFIEGCLNSALEKSAATTGDDTTTTGDGVKVCCVVCSTVPFWRRW